MPSKLSGRCLLWNKVILETQLIFYCMPLIMSVTAVRCTMGRKFKLCCKKKHYTVTSLIVSLPLDRIKVFPVSVPLSALSFHVSIPRSVYLSSPLDNTHSLYRRLLKAEVVPTGECLERSCEKFIYHCFTYRLELRSERRCAYLTQAPY